MGASLDKRDSKGAYYSIISDLRLTDKEGFRTIGSNFYTFILFKEKYKIMCSALFSILYKWTLFIKKYFTTHASFCF